MSGFEILLISLFTIVVGLAFTFLGYQFFRILIPLWGFFAGFAWGADAIAVWLGSGFLVTLLSWASGLIVGLLIAFLAYYFYIAGVAILAGFIGYWLVGGLMLAIGFVPGFLVTLTATTAGIALAILAVVFGAPKGLLIVLSAFGGATATIGGVLILFGLVPVSVLGSGLMSSIIHLSFWWTLFWVTLAIFGVFAQFQASQELTIDEMTYTSTVAGTKGGKTSKKDEETDDGSD